MQLVNEHAILSTNNFVKEAYKFNLFFQVVLTTVNGVTLKQSNGNQGALINEKKDNEILKRNEIPIANIYFKFCHHDKADENIEEDHGTQLTNKY